jgi:hypothetical protein
MISLIHPSRNRPAKSSATIHKWITSASNIHDIELIVSCDLNDPLLSSYESIYSQTIFKTNPVVANENRSAVDAINYAASIAEGDTLIVVSDDTDCIPGWDQQIINHTSGKTDWILKTQDRIQPWIITMPIMDRAYYNRFGYVYHPDYQHMFCDTELTCVADLTGRKITSNLLFKHNHYSVTKEPQDQVSKRADKTWDQGEKLFLERYKRNFDLKEIKGKIEDNGMINWLQRKHALKSV